MATTKSTVAVAWGNVIRRQREHVTGESRRELADRLGVTRQTVRAWEEGINPPSSRMQGVLIARLGIDPVTVAHLIATAGDAA